MAFLSAWSNGDYKAMYELLAQEDRTDLSPEAFRASYLNALEAATVTELHADLRSILTEGSTASASFITEWQTAMFGPLSFENVMPLVWQNGRWVVDWSPDLVLPTLGEDLRLVLLDESAGRGNIYERNGLGLAVEGEMVTVGVVPGWITDMQTVLIQLSTITGVPVETIRDKIDGARPEWFVPVADVTPEVSINNNAVLASLDGVQRRERTVRAYKAGSLGAHVIGYLGAIPSSEVEQWKAKGYKGDELVGRSGVEGWGETILAGRRGGRLVTLTPQNVETSLVAEVAAKPGDSIYLSLDKGLQADAENILGERVGAIVVQEVNTGFILAMASYPRFDPNLFATGINQMDWTRLASDPNNPLLGRCTQGVYPPGSVFKVVSMMAAIDKLGMSPDATFTCTGTWNRLGDDFVKTCWLKTGHGTLTMRDGLTQSCDVVFYDIGLALQTTDPEILPQMALACGLGTPTGMTGMQEAAGLVPTREWKLTELGESWFPGDSVNLAIGQSYLLTTPLQVTNLISAIANGGTLYRPQLVHRIAKRSGGEEFSQPEAIGQLPARQETLAIIRAAMEGVVSGPRGTAREAFAGAAFTAAGKTGTSETGQEDPHAWFAGYLPVENPQIAISVILEHAGEGSKEAAPAFRQMVEAFLARQAAS
jgi:penicillin-binding protein 2